MEWLDLGYRKFIKWGKEVVHALMLLYARSLWGKEADAVHSNLLTLDGSSWSKQALKKARDVYENSLWRKQTVKQAQVVYENSVWAKKGAREINERDDKADYAKIMISDFCVGLAYGMTVGVGLVLYWVYCSHLRSQERQEKASNVAALSDMNLEDVRKFFPQEYFPYWIVMGKYEKVHWINYCVKKAWPFYTKSQSELLKELWEPWIDPYRPPSISQLSFSEFSLGSIPPVLLGVRMVHTTNDEIAMDAKCQWQGNPSIIMKVRTPVGLTFPIQLKNASMLVVLRIIFRPLVDELPGFGAFTYSIKKNKKFDFTLKLVGGDIATIPGLGSTVEEMIKTSFLDILMWPMRIPVPVIPSPIDRDSSRLQRHFNPRRGAVWYSDNDTLKVQAAGILDIKLVQAKDLKMNKLVGKVAPYAFLFIRPIPRLMKRSKTISDNLNPIWNEIYELEVEDLSTETLGVKILDELAEQETELLGCCQVAMKDLEPGVLTENWIKLVKSIDKVDIKYRGEVNVEMLFRPYDQSFQSMSNPQHSNENIPSTSTSSSLTSGTQKAFALFNDDIKARDGDRTHALHPLFSFKGQLWEVVRGVLSVTVERAENLVSRDVFGLSDPYVVLEMRNSKAKKKTKVQHKTLNPEWNQNLDFLVEDGIHDMLHIKVWDHDTCGKDFLGSYATTLTTVIQSGEYNAEFKLHGVSSGMIFMILTWTPQPFKKMGQRRLGVF